MIDLKLPRNLLNLIAGEERAAAGFFSKLSPASGKELFLAARSGAPDVEAAVSAAVAAKRAWADTPAVQRGMKLLSLVRLMQDHQAELAAIVAAETGKSPKEAAGEVGGAAQCGLFFAGEGQRLYGRTCTSGTPGKQAMTVRRPVGVAGLVVPANTPIANVAWKVFPALICGNSVVLKSAEDSPATAWAFGRLAAAAGVPSGVLNIVHGYGAEAGEALVRDPRVGVVSFTGSTAVGKKIAEAAAGRLCKVSLELGGKNPLVVCDDADLDNAVKWTLLSAFSNAGQRCAACSRIVVFESVYEEFKRRLLEKASALKVGPSDGDDLGPVVNKRQLDGILAAVAKAKASGARVLLGGGRLEDPARKDGFYMAPTILEGVKPSDEIARKELFGPVAALFKVRGYEEALALVDDCDYGLTACIHTRSFDRAMHFSQNASAGVVVVNAGTYGSEPHMPFGGLRGSGNGTREPGTEALDVYSELKDIYLNVNPAELSR